MNKHKISNRIIFSTVGIWFLVWAATQGIFMSEVLSYLSWDINTSYAIATIWVSIVAITALAIMPLYRKKSLPKSKLLWLYSIPVILLIFLPQHYAHALDLWVYIPMIIITVFWQDYLTFGILQPALSKRLTPNKAAILAAIIFTLGHVVFFLNSIFDAQLLLIALAGFVFALSSRYTGNIYIANIIHVIFYLI